MVPDVLLDAALRTFAERGPTKARLEDIRKQAGMSVGAVYHHVADKEDLGHAVYADALGRYQDGLLALLRDEPSAEAGIRAGVRHHLEWCARHPRETRFLQTGRGFAD